MEARLVPDVDAPDTRPGDIEYRELGGVAMGFAFRCPCCGGQSWLPVNCPDGWEWDGNKEKPTLSPSIANRFCSYHGYLRAGIFVDA